MFWLLNTSNTKWSEHY